MWSIVGLIIVAAVVVTIIFMMVFVFNVAGAVLSLIMRVIQSIGRTVLKLIADVTVAAVCVVKAVVLSMVAIGAMLLGRWPSAKRTGAKVRALFKRAGRRLSDLPTRAVSRAARTPAARRAESASTDDTDPFPGWRIVGELKAGGSGAQLFIAEPLPGNPHRVDRAVLKVFDLRAGSPLPQMVRESRALEGARKLGMVLEHRIDKRRFWYAMPFIPGDHLGKAIGNLHVDNAGLSGADMRTALCWCGDLLSTLGEYHAAGLWHKDIKPENIIVNHAGAHLVDIGLVTSLHSAMTLTTHGTEYFRDPELVRQAIKGTKVSDVDGSRFDIYSAGAVLYFMVEGTFPAHGSLSRFSAPCPSAVQWIIRRAMADYNQRYASVRDMAVDLQAVLSATAIEQVVPAHLPSVGNDVADKLAGVPGHGARLTPQRRPQAVEVGAPLVVSRTAGVVRGLWEVREAMLRARDDRRRSLAIDKAARKAAKRQRRSTQRQAFAAFVVGIVAIAGVALFINEFGEHDFAGTKPETVASIQSIEPVGAGNALVVNQIGADPAAGDALASQLTSWGWHPVRDAETEATFRRALPASGQGAADFEDRVRAAIKELRLDAAAFLHADESDSETAWVLVLTADDTHRMQLSTVQ